jgi:peptidoglycan/xylan/chitin deacetylase (PgdA/CDA1 family)
LTGYQNAIDSIREGAERTYHNGDGHSEPYLWEKGASGGYKEGAPYVNQESEYEYGSRVGAWRLLRLFKEFNYNWTTYAVAQAMQVNPKFAKACVRDGHEIATHGLRWLDIWDYDLEKEKEYIIQSLKVLKEVTGEMPVGAYYGRGTPNTKALFPEAFKEAGSEMLWNSEAYNDDVPYWIDLPAEKELPEDQKQGCLILPYNYDCNGTSSLAIAHEASESANALHRWQVPHVTRLRWIRYV